MQNKAADSLSMLSLSAALAKDDYTSESNSTHSSDDDEPIKPKVVAIIDERKHLAIPRAIRSINTSFTGIDLGEVAPRMRTDSNVSMSPPGMSYAALRRYLSLEERDAQCNQRYERLREELKMINMNALEFKPEDLYDPLCDPDKPVQVTFNEISAAAYCIKGGVEYTPCTVLVLYFFIFGCLAQAILIDLFEI